MSVYCLSRISFLGGYNHPNAARLWANLTAVVAGVTLDNNIPEHDHWPKYGPDYQLSIQPCLAKDLNKEQYLFECVAKIKCMFQWYLLLIYCFIAQKKNCYCPHFYRYYRTSI